MSPLGCGESVRVPLVGFVGGGLDFEGRPRPMVCAAAFGLSGGKPPAPLDRFLSVVPWIIGRVLAFPLIMWPVQRFEQFPYSLFQACPHDLGRFVSGQFGHFLELIICLSGDPNRKGPVTLFPFPFF